MSTIRYFDTIPHIIQYGMSDNENETGWIIFFRLGTKFKITITRSDILGTRFEKKWMDLRPPPGDVCLPGWAEQHDHLSDCIISQAMDLLVKLAPVREYWTSFQEYLHTPAYVLKMVRDERSGDTKAVVVEGPDDGPAYGMNPMGEDEVGMIPEDLPRISSERVIVTGRETDWRRAPHQARVSLAGWDETEYTLKPMDRTAKNVTTGKMVNASLDSIRAYMVLHQQCKVSPDGYPAKIPRPVAIITDTPGTPINPSPPTTSLSITPHPQSRIAGLLLTPLPKIRTLYNVLTSAKTDPTLILQIKPQTPKWKSQTLSILSSLHSRGVYCGARANESWYFVNQFVILVDEGWDVWIDPLVKVADERERSMVDGEGKKEENGMLEWGRRMDLKGVEVVFETWLKGEMGKIEDGGSK